MTNHLANISKLATDKAKEITETAPATAPGAPAIAKNFAIKEPAFSLENLPDPMLDSAANPLLKPLLQEDTAKENEKGKGESFVSKGQHIHKWSTYLAVDWIFNTAVGVSFAYWGKYSKVGKAMWSDNLTKGFTSLLKPIIKNPASLAASVEKGNLFMSIIAGGMFTLPPLMVLENKKIKKSLTQSIDEVVYGKDAVQNDPKFKECYDEIDNEPKKGFWNGMAARLLALSPLLAMVMIPKSRDFTNKVYFDHVAHASETVATQMGYSAKSFKSVSAVEGAERWKFIHDGVAMDFGLGIPYAVLHAFFYKQCAAISEKWFGKKDKPEAITAPVADSNAQLSSGEITTMTAEVSETKSFAAQHKSMSRPAVKTGSFAASLETTADMKQMAL